MGPWSAAGFAAPSTLAATAGVGVCACTGACCGACGTGSWTARRSALVLPWCAAGFAASSTLSATAGVAVGVCCCTGACCGAGAGITGSSTAAFGLASPSCADGFAASAVFATAGVGVWCWTGSGACCGACVTAVSGLVPPWSAAGCTCSSGLAATAGVGVGCCTGACCGVCNAGSWTARSALQSVLPWSADGFAASSGLAASAGVAGVCCCTGACCGAGACITGSWTAVVSLASGFADGFAASAVPATAGAAAVFVASAAGWPLSSSRIASGRTRCRNETCMSTKPSTISWISVSESFSPPMMPVHWLGGGHRFAASCEERWALPPHFRICQHLTAWSPKHFALGTLLWLWLQGLGAFWLQCLLAFVLVRGCFEGLWLQCFLAFVLVRGCFPGLWLQCFRAFVLVRGCFWRLCSAFLGPLSWFVAACAGSGCSACSGPLSRFVAAFGSGCRASLPLSWFVAASGSGCCASRPLSSFVAAFGSWGFGCSACCGVAMFCMATSCCTSLPNPFPHPTFFKCLAGGTARSFSIELGRFSALLITSASSTPLVPEDIVERSPLLARLASEPPFPSALSPGPLPAALLAELKILGARRWVQRLGQMYFVVYIYTHTCFCYIYIYIHTCFCYIIYTHMYVIYICI